MSGRSPKRFSISKLCLILIVAFGGLLEAASWLGLRINPSPSLPLGIYRVANDGNLVEFCPTEPYASMSAIRGYRQQGNCPDGAMPLLKPIAARAGDLVEVSSSGLSVNERLIPNTRPLLTDSKGRLLPAWPTGVYRVLPDQIWVLSSYNYRSFDSRYYGPIANNQIRAHLKALAVQWW